MVRALPVAEEDVVWYQPDGSPLPLHVSYYVTQEPPEERLVTSVRAVVFARDEVLVLRNPDGVHALPGGRREPGESFEATLRREVLEETGYAIGDPRPLGFARLRPLAPTPPVEFLWAVYVAESDGHRLIVPTDDYEQKACFEPVAHALERVDLPSRIYVRAATQAFPASRRG